MRSSRLLIVVSLCPLVLACAGNRSKPEPVDRDGSVGWTVPAVPAHERMELASNERFQYPLPAPSNALPSYPDSLLSGPLSPQVVCVAVSIGEAGEVFRIDPVEFGDDCQATREAPEAMRQAVFDALGFWRFEAAFRCIYPQGVQPGLLGCQPPGREVPASIRMPYRFVFEQREGRGVVSGD